MGLRGLLDKAFPPIAVTKEFISPLAPRDCHDAVLGALNGAGYQHVTDSGDALTGEHGRVDGFRAASGLELGATAVGLGVGASGDWGSGGDIEGEGSTSVFDLAMLTPAAEYPISVQIALAPIDGDAGTQVSVTASYVRPPTFMGAPRGGEMHDRWLQACDGAVDLVTRAALPGTG